MVEKEFENNGYLVIPKILSKELLDFIDVYVNNVIRVNEINGINICQDPQVPNTPSLYRDRVMENLSDFLLPKIESAIGMKLLSTFTYFRMYKVGDILEKHTDRPACEISVTLSLRKEGKIWPIYVNNTDYRTRENDKVEFTPLPNSHTLSREEMLERLHKEHIKDTTSILLEEGDSLVYKGCEIVHWREPYNEGTKLAQVVLSYIDANGRFTEWDDDKPLKNVEKVNDYTITGIFPCPVYVTKRDTNLDSTEEKEIEDIIAEGMFLDGTCGEAQDQHTDNTYIFNTNLKNLKEFCEEHIKNYVKKIIVPKNEELDFYITQSWINVLEPGGRIQQHSHANSSISGIFYLTVEEDDTITFIDAFWKYKRSLNLDNREFNLWNSSSWSVPVNNNELILFPSWLEYAVEPNEKATTNRISLAFNVFVKGTLGNTHALNELIL